jgi:hypothetical protein
MEKNLRLFRKSGQSLLAFAGQIQDSGGGLLGFAGGMGALCA